jgi:hypothetical protein
MIDGRGVGYLCVCQVQDLLGVQEMLATVLKKFVVSPVGLGEEEGCWSNVVGGVWAL